MSQDEASAGWRSEFDSDVHPETVWTGANIQEALPGLVTPMTWSLMRETFDYAFARPAKRVGVYASPADAYVAFFYGRAFLNLSALRASAERLPLSSAAALDEQFFGIARNPGVPLRLPRFRRLISCLPVLARMLWVALRTPAEIREAERRVRVLEEGDKRLDLDSLGPSALIAEVKGGFGLAKTVAATHIGVSGGTSVCFDLLGHLTRDWLDDTDGSLQAILVSGLSELESARPGKALWQLSRLALAAPAAMQAVELADAPAALDGLRANPDTDVRAFVIAYDAFLVEMGHRSVMELEVAAAAWEEDPTAVFAMIRPLLSTEDASGPAASLARQRAAREEATRAARRKLAPPRRLLFTFVLAQAQRYVVFRERTKSLLVRGSNRTRRLLRRAGRMLKDEGRLAGPADLYFLTLDEAAALASGGLPAEFAERIRRRRAESERNESVVVPETFEGRPHPIVRRGDAVSRMLRGIPVSPGRATGRARVVRDPRSAVTLAPGEVLVVPLTDAAWTPLFLAACALVVDVGGPLSHGATVARELGLPAVVNVRDGTRAIRDGQLITVDGRAGTVLLEED